MPERPERGNYLIDGGIVVTVDPDLGILDPGQILVRNGEIVAVGRDLDAEGAEVIDARRMIVMPGLIESHWHMWSSLGRNFISEGYEYFPAKWDTSAHYEPEDFYRSVLLGAVEALNAGITTVHNWSHNTRTPAHADAELRAHHESMVRTRYSYGHRDLLPEDEELDFTDIDRVAEEWFGDPATLDGLVHLGVNLRGPDLGSDAVFHREVAQARERGLPISIHTMQGGSTKVDAVELENHGYLDGSSFLICHFLAARDADMEAMARNNTPLSFTVHSEMRLGEAGDPRAALLRFRDAGVTVSLSIDATSIAPVNLFEAMNVAWNMGIPWEGTPTAEMEPITFRQCIEMATINGAVALGIDDQVGSLTAGKRADLIMIRADDLNVAPVVDVESTVVRSIQPSNVDTVMIDGRILKRGGDLVAHDPAEIVAAAEESALAIRRRAGGRLAPD
jgi:5-methylthioadenosine/S-adenosylhomocysteine deaminase